MNTLAALTVLVLLGPDGADDALARSMSTAAEQTLGDEAHVVVQRVDAFPADDAVAALATSSHADAVAEVRGQEGGRVVIVRVLVAGEARWVDREIRFAPSDAPVERGRTLGYAVASILPERARRDEAPVQVAQAHSSPPSALAPAPAVAPVPLPVPAVHLPGSPPGSDGETGPDVTAAPAPPRGWSGAIDLSGGVTSTIGTGGSAGGSIGGHGYLTPHFGVHGAAGLRAGEIEAAEASALYIDLDLGVAWRSGDPSRKHPFGAGARVDLALTRQELSHHVRATQQKESQGSWMPGASAVMEGMWAFSEGAVAVLGLGSRASFGTTDLYLRGVPVAKLAPISLLATAGIRARF